MLRLSFLVFFLVNICYGQSPHGETFDLACENCHTTDSWKVNIDDLSFDHDKTPFPLLGQHKSIKCESCHKNLVFENTLNNCADCHTDMHQNTVGDDCARCHDSNSWLVYKITEIHQLSRFPLIGNHLTADCAECHSSSSNLQFEPLGIECISCHENDYNSSKNPDHIAAGFSTECNECHDLYAFEWNMSEFAHEFFPLVKAHKIDNCFDCHKQNSFEGLSSECNSCHIENYNSSTNPNHRELSFPSECGQCHSLSPGWTPAEFVLHENYYPLVGAHSDIKNDCNSCHTNGYSNTPNQCIGCHENDFNSTLNPSHLTLNFSTDCEECHSMGGWKPATFDHDGQFFPIYSGEHNRVWDACSDCHTDPGNYANFSCVTCHDHNQGEMDSEHNGVSGYIYESAQCFSCHPTGSEEGAFNHATSAFPLVGTHTQVGCEDCHGDGYSGTNSDCYNCHQSDYQGAVNPNHSTLNINLSCEICHSMEPEWKPAQFPIHDNYYQLLGAHFNISNDCTSCHNGDYNNTSDICSDCHQADYDNTSDPPHLSNQFGTDCEACHTQDKWIPATFEHDGQYFPIYTGEHAGEWDVCSDCHNVQSNYKIIECINCHEHNKTDTDNEHIGLSGYFYASSECYACHPDGTNEGFNHALSNFPLTGSHISLECRNCHEVSYQGTSSDCYACHESDYNNSVNPGHQILALETSCETCHTTDPGWSPAQFPVHNNYYELLGAHASIANDCESCHNSDYNNTPDLCVGCHRAEYDQTTDPNHTASGYTTECESCHSPDAWTPATFDHTLSNFTLTGAHITVDCQDCHVTSYQGTSSDCYACHESDYNNSVNPGHQSLALETSCETCHTTDPGWSPAQFSVHNNYYELLGAHASIANDCESCHNSDYNNTPDLCVGCHRAEYDQTTDPNHTASGYTTECESCHSQEAWTPATFDHTLSNFPLTGAHVTADCQDCHVTSYQGTSSDCYSCHESDYNNSVNPGHQSLALETSCETCHTTDPGWSPAQFPVHNNYYELLGAHASIANDCESCHNSDYNNTPDLCVGCHRAEYDQATDPNHTASGFTTDCESCHSQNTWIPSTFDHDGQYFPIYSGEHRNEWNTCSDCHTVQSNYSIFECINCHEHNEADMNSEHNGVNDYIYLSTACYDCHPDGSE